MTPHLEECAVVLGRVLLIFIMALGVFEAVPGF
jgi:hypothetical protein